MKTNNEKDPQLPQKSVNGDTLISDTDLSARTKKIFENSGMSKVEDILSFNLNHLMRFRGFGKKSILEIKQFRADNGCKD